MVSAPLVARQLQPLWGRGGAFWRRTLGPLLLLDGPHSRLKQRRSGLLQALWGVVLKVRRFLFPIHPAIQRDLAALPWLMGGQ